jgi:hypothetical protein
MGALAMKTFDVTAPTPQGPASRDEQTFLLGIEFHEAALRAGQKQTDLSGAPVDALCPMIVSYAFAAELYLKSLIRTKVRSHELDGLFKALSSPTRKKIETAYGARTGRNHRALESDLKEMGSAFLDWRYVFEGEGQQIHTNLLISLAKSLLETAKFDNPSWANQARHENQIHRLLAPGAEPSMTLINLGGGTFLHVTDGTGGTLNTPEA